MKLVGPAGGNWQLCDGRAFCVHCGRFVNRAWRYCIGALIHATICEECADNPKEEDHAPGGGPQASR